jgi:hypothetical protein
MGFMWRFLADSDRPTMHSESGRYRGIIERQLDGTSVWRIERVSTGEIIARGDAQSVAAAMDEADAALGWVCAAVVPPQPDGQ